MIIQSGLPSSFWAEAISTANYVRNRCITKSLDSGTPFEKWTGRRPSVAHIRTFGCKAFVLNKSLEKGKFDIRGIEGIFVGYSESSKAYRVWNPRNRKIHVSRDAKIFDEFDVKESPEDIVDHNTKNGPHRFLDDTDWEESSSETYVGPNSSSPIEERTDNDEVAREPVDDNVEVPRRGPGRPKGATNRKPTPPTKQYNLRSNKQEAPSEPTGNNSDEDVEWHDSMFAMLASKIDFMEAVTGPESTE